LGLILRAESGLLSGSWGLSGPHLQPVQPGRDRELDPDCQDMSQYFDQLCAAVESAKGDVSKAEEGNKAATSRVRKAMQDIKNIAQDIRKEMLELRDAGGKQG
jgi:hypothetical protein